MALPNKCIVHKINVYIKVVRFFFRFHNQSVKINSDHLFHLRAMNNAKKEKATAGPALSIPAQAQQNGCVLKKSFDNEN